ncbi:hypothetical protein N0V85_009598 [Neurospora sp. IMI 360204]|nr:hypothetical protein N0V85_009598 [Neurospora sp. IMI 360204]
MPELAGYKDKGKEIFKKGWHPEKEGTTLKGQVKGLLGRGEDPRERYADHQSTPIASLRDPASFPPPPKRRTAGDMTPPPPPSRPTSTNPAESHQYGQQQQYEGHTYRPLPAAEMEPMADLHHLLALLPEDRRACHPDYLLDHLQLLRARHRQAMVT